MKKIRITTILLICILMLSGCEFSSFDTNTLLTPPLMSPADQEIRKAISDAVGGSYEPVYAKGGLYQNAITPIDLTSEDHRESFCFYKAANEQYVSFIVLQNKDGKWKEMGRKNSQAMGVERVDFCDITGDGKKEIVIGWQYLSGEENALEIFSITGDGEIKSEYTGMYNDFITSNGCVTVISKNSAAKTASATLIGGSKKGALALSTVSLNNSIAGFTKIQTSNLENGTTLIYIDEQLESFTYTTELLILSTQNEPILSAAKFNNMTVRTRAYTCIDANSDDVLDIPMEKQLSSYIRNGNEERLTYVDWYSIKDGEPKYIKSTYSSVNEPFYIQFKNEWIDKITIEKDESSERIIHFYVAETKQPMFSIRVFSRQEYTDSKEQDVWKEIAASGENVYTYRQDGVTLAKEFYTDTDIISKLFVVLS